MQCSRCGSQNKASNDYCEGCGAALGIKCDACDHINRSTSRFCGQCGTALVSTSANPDLSTQRILRSLSTKGGERKRLTLLFADIRNSTSLIDSLGDPELAMRRLEPVLDLMKDAVTTVSSTRYKVMASWRFSVRRDPMRIMPYVAAWRHWPCRMQWRGLRTRVYRYASASIPVKSLSKR